MKKALLVVDPQYDFITGTLPVPGAAEAMSRLADYIMERPDYNLKIITADWHPYDHSSFADAGGPWPRHCVQHSQGAAVFQPVLDAAFSTPGSVVILTKGDTKDTEEYSIFANTASAATLDALLADIDRVDICGLAGDICVLNTLRDGVSRFGAGKFHALTEFSPSLDGGTALSKAAAELG